MHSVWQIANKFGKKFANLCLKFGVLIIGEIAWQFFLPNAVCRKLFAWQKHLVKSTPCSQFHQHFTSNFYECRSQKRKKDWHLDCISCSFGICTCLMLLVKCWWNRPLKEECLLVIFIKLTYAHIRQLLLWKIFQLLRGFSFQNVFCCCSREKDIKNFFLQQT